MHPETKHDLDRIKEIEEERRSLDDELRTIKENCKHYNYKPELIETLAFEHTPAHICVVCGHQVDKKVGRKEQRILWKNCFHWFTDDKIELIIE